MQQRKKSSLKKRLRAVSGGGLTSRKHLFLWDLAFFNNNTPYTHTVAVHTILHTSPEDSLTLESNLWVELGGWDATTKPEFLTLHKATN